MILMSITRELNCSGDQKSLEFSDGFARIAVRVFQVPVWFQYCNGRSRQQECWSSWQLLLQRRAQINIMNIRFSIFWHSAQKYFSKWKESPVATSINILPKKIINNIFIQGSTKYPLLAGIQTLLYQSQSCNNNSKLGNILVFLSSLKYIWINAAKLWSGDMFWSDLYVPNGQVEMQSPILGVTEQGYPSALCTHH